MYFDNKKWNLLLIYINCIFFIDKNKITIFNYENSYSYIFIYILN